MAPFTTPADVAEITGQTFTSAQETRLPVLIRSAERYVKREAGRVFYEEADPDSDASQDWLQVVSLVVERYLAAEDPAARAAVLGPYQSEKSDEYSYTVKSNVGEALGVDANPLIAAIISAYKLSEVLLPIGLVVNGPTRVAGPVYDPDVDISRDSRPLLGHVEAREQP